MEIIVKVNKLNDIEKLDKVDGYLLSNRHFSYRFDESFCINKIRKVKTFAKKHGKKVYVLINKIFKDHEIEKLTDFLTKLKKVDVDGIFFADLGVFMVASELDMQDKCIFYHETFLRNTYDILTYQSYGINKVVCSKDMNLEDIKLLNTENKDNYGILCFGYIPLYQSQRQIISNYVKQNNLDKSIINSKQLTLKEHTREEHYKVIQQEGISSIFESNVLSYLPYIKQLSQNINMFIVDSLFFDVDYINNVIDLIYQSYEGKDVTKQLENLNEKVSFTDGFLNKRIGLM